MLRILGIDPGSRVTGYAVIEMPAPELVTAGGRARLSYVECGVLEVDARLPVATRLAEIRANLDEVIRELCPTVVAVEGVFVKTNPRTALKLGQARGVALAAAGAAGLAVHEYPPATVKLAVVGHGNASKQQVQQMVRVLLSMSSVPRVDAADALAVAITHAHRAARPALAALERS